MIKEYLIELSKDEPLGNSQQQEHLEKLKEMGAPIKRNPKMNNFFQEDPKWLLSNRMACVKGKLHLVFRFKSISKIH